MNYNNITKLVWYNTTTTDVHADDAYKAATKTGTEVVHAVGRVVLVRGLTPEALTEYNKAGWELSATK